ncbi:MAG: hypothetical protein ACE5OQ_13405, partial [Woeseia sp.]
MAANVTCGRCVGALFYYPHPRQLVFRKKDSGYLAVFMGVSAGFDLKTQLNDALIESWPPNSKCLTLYSVIATGFRTHDCHSIPNT